ncbi:MAG: sugar transferase [Thermodesulfobacteriota bacterium]|nr:sugar transferase [Thermodesulfobacteriota bacterium]
MTFRRTLLLALYKLSDIVILLCSLAYTIIVNSSMGGPSNLSNLLSAQISVQNSIVLAIAITIWHFIFQFLGLYETKRFGHRIHECMDVLKATSLGTCLITLFMSLFYMNFLNGSFIFHFWISATFLTIAARMTMRLILIVVRNRGRNLRFMVIVGTNQRVLDFAKKVKTRKDLGYELVGFVDNECFHKENGVQLISRLEDFAGVLNQHVVDEVVIGLPVQTFYNEIKEIAGICEEQGIIVRFLADMLFDLRFAKSSIDYLDESPILTLYTGPMDSWFFWGKRAFDILFSSIALLFLLPVFVIAGILIKLDSPGPVFFIQKRVGYNKRLFKAYKFRTMIKGAEKQQSKLEQLNEMSGPVFKIKNDPRITKIGRIMRKTSIDELPQLFNVLKGDMSLIGPRPLPVRDYERFEEEWHKRRFSIRPGLTCLWQINGRNGMSFDKWVELDMEYIDNWSLLLDLKILIKTIPAVFKGSGAM